MEYTTEELKARLERIWRQQSHWASSTDGSHGMALDRAGYFKVMEELKARGCEFTGWRLKEPED